MLSTDFYMACMDGDISMIIQYLNDHPDCDLDQPEQDTQFALTPLENACSGNSVEAMRLLIECGADPHFNLEKPLRIAAARGNLDAVKLLLQYEPNLHVLLDLPLFRAVEAQHLAVVKELIYAGANLDAFMKDSSRNLDHLADSEVMTVLLQLKPIHDILRDANVSERRFAEAYNSETVRSQSLSQTITPEKIRDFLDLPDVSTERSQYHDIVITKELLEIAEGSDDGTSILYLLKTAELTEEAAMYAYRYGLSIRHSEIIDQSKRHGANAVNLGFDELLHAITINNCWGVEYLLYSEGVDPAMHGFAGPRLAIQNTRSEILTVFIRAGISAESFLTEAAARQLLRSEQTEILDALVEECVDSAVRWKFILQYTIEFKMYKYALKLIERKVDSSSIYGEHLLEIIRDQQFKLLLKLLSNGTNWKPLYGVKTGETYIDSYLRALEALESLISDEMRPVVQFAAESTDIQQEILRKERSLRDLLLLAERLVSEKATRTDEDL